MAKILAWVALLGMLMPPAPIAAYGQDSSGVNRPVPQQAAPALRIGFGDLIDIALFEAPELSGRFRVDEKGDIQVPLLGTVQVQGLTADQAAKLIEKLYVRAQILKPETAKATVFIEEYATQGIVVAGEVKTPGVFPALGVRMLNDVMVAAGGVLPTAASKVIIIRRSDPAHRLVVDYNPEALNPIIPQVQILPGDTVIVPKAGMVYILGAVNRPGGYELNGRSTLSVEEAMALAGNSANAARMKHVQLVRNLPDQRKEMMIFSVDRILKGEAPDVALKDGDILYVPISNKRLAIQQIVGAAFGIGTQVAIYKIALQ